MEEVYEVFCRVCKQRNRAKLFISEKKDIYKIVFVMGVLSITVKAENYFYALVELRKKLESHNIDLLCKGCSRHVYPSPMILSMGDALDAYELTLGKPARTKDIVNIFEPCEIEEYATVEEQLLFYKEWVNSKKN